MKHDWTKTWKASVQPRKQRKYRYNSPTHVLRKFLGCHLSKDLRKKYNTRSVPLRSGDKVKVLRGANKGHVGKVDRINLIHSKVYVTGIERIKKDGSKVVPPVNPSNLMITELELLDKKRIASLARKTKKSSTSSLSSAASSRNQKHVSSPVPSVKQQEKGKQ